MHHPWQNAAELLALVFAILWLIVALTRWLPLGDCYDTPEQKQLRKRFHELSHKGALIVWAPIDHVGTKVAAVALFGLMFGMLVAALARGALTTRPKQFALILVGLVVYGALLAALLL